MAQTASDKKSVALVQKALHDIRRGRMVILTDDEDRENEGDLVMAAEKVTPQAINFMAKHGRGLICLALTEDRLRQLNLPLMVQDNTSPFQTAFTVSIEAARGVTTGISAADRARTVLAAVARNAKPGDLVRPGHIFPLRAREGGVLVRTGQTEGSVDLSRLSGLSPAGVICEVMNEDGTMARRPQLLRFARRHKLTLLSVADIIAYRLTHERLVRRAGTVQLSREPWGELTVHAFKSDVDSAVHLAIVKGNLSGDAPVLTRVHRSAVLGELLDSGTADGTIGLALKRLCQEGRGVLVYLDKEVTPESALALNATPSPVPGRTGGGPPRLHEFGVGAQILKDLGLSKLRLLTNTPKHVVGLESWGLKITEQVRLSPPRETSGRRLRTH